MTADASTDLPRAGATQARVRLAASARAAEARLDTAIADLSLDEALRPDEQGRAAAQAILAAAVDEAAQGIAAHAARRVGERGNIDGVHARLTASGVLADRSLVRAVLTAARTVTIDESLIATRAPEDTPLLLPRLADHRDPLVRDRATAFLLADSRRRRATVAAPELQPEVAHRLAWLVAASLAQLWGEGDVAVARALADATVRHLAAEHEDRFASAAATKLAATLDLPVEERGETLNDALVEGRVMLFAAMLGHAVGSELGVALDAALDPDPAALLTMLRAGGLERDACARIGLRLLEADRMRDAEVLADEVDAAAALSVEDAQAAIAPLTLDPDFRAAAAALERGAL